jgi:inosine-uridine nucleoside N-ribohydrolase
MQQVLFDTDPGCDDAVMLAMALGSDDVDVVGLSTVYGNSTVSNTTRNALSILALGGHDVPVARGCHRPLVDEATTAEWVHGEGGIRGDMPDPTASPVDTHGAEFIVEQAREHGSDLVVAAVGPLTNLAVALSLEPDLPNLVDEIYLMGGSAFAPGNVTPVAEANVHNDPAAAARVFQDADPKMVGLDVTNHATVPYEDARAFREMGGIGRTIADWLDYPEEVDDLTADGVVVHDAAVVADIVDPDVLTLERMHAEIDTTGGPSHGSVVADRHGITGADPTCEVAVDIDVERFRGVLSSTVASYVDS